MAPDPNLDLDPHREAAELRAYLGDAYVHERLQHWDRTLEEEALAVDDEQRLYRTSQGYLYNLTAFAMTGVKDPYRAWIPRAVAPGGRLLDVGCGIGADGLALAAAGYRVTFADFDNPSVAYLRWRLEHRGLADRATLHDLDAGPLPAGHDLAYAFDVLEHVEEPFALLDAMERAASLVLVNVLDPEPGDTVLHHDLPVAEVLAHAERRGLERYRRYHHRSHLLLYRSPPRTRPRALSKLALVRGRALSART